MISQSHIKDNRKRGTVAEFLKKSIEKDSKLSVVSAYFTIYAYEKLKKELDDIGELRFLFGEPSFLKGIDPKKSNKRDFEIAEDKLTVPLTSIIEQKGIAKECADWIKNKVEIRSMVKPNFLHGKMYHIQEKSGKEKAIVGSSNFTVRGLGLSPKHANMELNVIIDNDRDREDLKEWFEELWSDDTGLVEDVKEEVLKYLGQLYIENDPEFVYFKTLYHVFENYLLEQNQSALISDKVGFYETEIWEMLYDFQKDGVTGAINKILQYNGCIIADSVGLGKTFEALAVIKYFELLNYRVLVLCPKKLSENWTEHQLIQNREHSLFKKDKFNYTVLYHTDLGRTEGIAKANGINLENLNWGAYDLVVIDESHNFKGNPLEKKQDDDTIKYNRPKWLLEKIIKEGLDTKVLLLSATPVNNSLKDLRNQIHLITKGQDNALEENTQIRNIGETLKVAQTKFTNWSKPKKTQKQNKTVKRLLDELDTEFFKLLDTLTIARSRKHIKNFYQNVEEELGTFPKREKPISIHSPLDNDKRAWTYEQIEELISKYALVIFKPSDYVKEELKEKYEERSKSQGVDAFKQSTREDYLVGMMKVNFLKRLESSVKAFEISMDRTIEKIEKLEEKIEEFERTGKSTATTVTENILKPEAQEDLETEELWQVGKKLKFELQDLKLDKWKNDLKNDKQALIQLLTFAKSITPERDAKLAELKSLITNKLKEGKNNNNRKVLIFTAFADTANYLYKQIKEWAKKEHKLHTAMVAGRKTYTSFGRNNFAAILHNFAPKAKNRTEKGDEIDILIGTDCISEGQNLQDCDYLINYDIHWNPIRVIQRFGRIDRLGSQNESIQLVNFWPTADLDSYINLKHRVETKMALVDLSATGEDDILNEKELIKEELKFRNKQLKKLQNEVLDLEEMDESIEFSQFTMDDFRIELLNFLDSNRQKLAEAPLGLYAVVPAPDGKNAGLYNENGQKREFSKTEKEIIQAGVVFCLRQKTESKENEKLNPLQPYYLAYIREDGKVRFNYTSAKQTLEIFKNLCIGYKDAFEQVCDIFNQETNNGKDMDKYTRLLMSTVQSIGKLFGKKSTAKVQRDRRATFSKKSEKINMNNFELITWLVIK